MLKMLVQIIPQKNCGIPNGIVPNPNNSTFRRVLDALNRTTQIAHVLVTLNPYGPFSESPRVVKGSYLNIITVEGKVKRFSLHLSLHIQFSVFFFSFSTLVNTPIN